MKKYKVAMKFSVDLKDKQLSDALELFKLNDNLTVLKDAMLFTYKAVLDFIPTKDQIKEMEKIFLNREMKGMVVCGCRFKGYEYLEEIEE